MPYIPVTRGGDLITSPDAKNAGPENCTQRWNIKRVQDKDVMRPGWTIWLKSFPEGIGQINLIAEAIRPDGTYATIVATATTIYRWSGHIITGQWYTVGTGFNQGLSSPRRWEARNLNGYLILNNGYDLPVAYQIIDGNPGAPVTPIYEMREAGIVSVDSIWVWNGVLFLGRPTELTDAAFDGWMSGATPYGRPPANMLTTTPTRIVWSSDPVRWKVSVAGSVTNGSNVVTLAFASKSFKIGQAVMFVETEDITADSPDAITEIIPEATITDISGNLVTLDVAATSNATGMLIPMDYFSQLVGFDDTTADGQNILRIWSLGERLVIFMTRGIITGAATGDAAQPFVFEIAYSGTESLTNRWLIHDINDKIIIFYGDRRWYYFDLINRKPRMIEKFSFIQNIFASGIGTDSFIAHNEIDKELWIFMHQGGSGVVVYDYENDVLSQVDHSFTAAATVYNPPETGILLPAGLNRIFLHTYTPEAGSPPTVYRQNTLRSGGPMTAPGVSFLRAGYPYESVLQWGYWSPRGQQEVLLQSWRLVIAFAEDVLEYTVQIERMNHPDDRLVTDNPPGTRKPAIPDQLINDVRKNLLTMQVQSPYFQETIRFSQPLQILGRDFEYKFVTNRTRGW